LGGTFLFVVGLIDDRYRITPYVKLFAQIIAGCIAVLFGNVIGLPFNSFLGIPLTLLWIVGVTNSFNLLDNIDGLAAGVAAISSLMLFFSSVFLTNNPLGICGLIIAGAALGFLPYNFNPAKIFMGDCGSMFLGYSLAVLSISGTGRHITNLIVTLLVPVLILGVPIFDTFFVMIVRKMQGRGIFQGGKDHTSHQLVTLGLSQKKTVVLLYAVSLVFGLIGVLSFRLDVFVISTIAFLCVVILMFFGIFLSEGHSYNKKKLPLNALRESTVINTFFLHKKRIVEVFLDFISICIAYYTAYFLRFEGGLLVSNLYLLRESLIWVVVIKMSVFFVFGLYRGVWKYIGISDFFTIFKVVSLGSVFSMLWVTVLFRFQDYSRAVFFIDWLVLLFLIMGSRFMFRIIGEFIGRLQSVGKRVLIFGAGDMGEMVIREMRRNKSLQYIPVGFIDDNPQKRGSKIHGVPVLGSRHDITSLIDALHVGEVVIAVSDLDEDGFSEISRMCDKHGIPFKKIKGILDE